ncbi:hypothetical protein [Hymenobacter sp. BT190]|uniref:hypothetical protein n=1 Tax=Hymenobacter sp. BT190 TaxID=2763505 RepID=UPI00165123CA|nr:hypothetical protein [Hymenobacter sp. BT190]MBC6698064.1 hypothetical protein [Hymenobacter sp. BT190]
MAVTSPGPVGRLQLQAFLDKFNTLFADNELENIAEATFRILFGDMGRTFVNWRDLNMRNIRGGTYPLRYTDELDTIPEDMLVIGMQAIARDGVTGEQAAAGERKEPVYFQLIPLSGNGLRAYVDEKPETTERIGATWVLASGSEEDRVNSFPEFVEEDHPYKKGDTFKYTFPDGPTRLFEVKNDIDLQYNPLPTEEEEQPFYKPFAPFVVETHAQNTDLGTVLDRFIIQLASQNQEQGVQRTMLGFGKAQGARPAMLALQWQDANSEPVAKLEVCYSFTSEAEYAANPALPANVWVPVGGGPGPGGADVTAASVGAVFDNDNGEFFLQVVNELLLPTIRDGAVVPDKLEAGFLASIGQAIAAVTSQARLVRPQAEPLFFSSVDEANAQADYGDTVEALGTYQAVLTLKGGVTYATGGLMVNWNLLTDAGQNVITCKVVGNSQEGRYGGGAISVTGAGSDIVVEKALFPHGGYAVTQSAGRLTHDGLLRGDSPSDIVAQLSGTATFRHVAGPVRIGGSKGFVLTGAARAFVKSDSVIEQGYHRVVECSGTAKIRLEGGSLLTGQGFALSEVVYMDGGEVTLANGAYDNTSTGAPGAYLTGGTLILDNATLKSVGGTAGTVILRNGGQVTGAISGQLTVIDENASGASGPSELHIGSTSGLRVRRIRLTSHITLLSMLLDDNVASVTYQVATFSGGTWTGTADLNTLAEAQAALPAAGDAQYAAGVALLVKTNPVTAANASNVILTYA